MCLRYRHLIFCVAFAGFINILCQNAAAQDSEGKHEATFAEEEQAYQPSERKEWNENSAEETKDGYGKLSFQIDEGLKYVDHIYNRLPKGEIRSAYLNNSTPRKILAARIDIGARGFVTTAPPGGALSTFDNVQPIIIGNAVHFEEMFGKYFNAVAAMEGILCSILSVQHLELTQIDIQEFKSAIRELKANQTKVEGYRQEIDPLDQKDIFQKAGLLESHIQNTLLLAIGEDTERMISQLPARLQFAVERIRDEYSNSVAKFLVFTVEGSEKIDLGIIRNVVDGIFDFTEISEDGRRARLLLAEISLKKAPGLKPELVGGAQLRKTEQKAIEPVTGMMPEYERAAGKVQRAILGILRGRPNLGEAEACGVTEYYAPPAIVHQYGDVAEIAPEGEVVFAIEGGTEPYEIEVAAVPEANDVTTSESHYLGVSFGRIDVGRRPKRLKVVVRDARGALSAPVNFDVAEPPTIESFATGAGEPVLAPPHLKGSPQTKAEPHKGRKQGDVEEENPSAQEVARTSVLPDSLDDFERKLADRTIRAVQSSLGVFPDGIIGPITRDALRNYQEGKKLQPTGRLNAELLGVVLAYVIPVEGALTTYERNLIREDVLEIQRLLGMPRAKRSGALDNETRGAIQTYKEAIGWPDNERYLDSRFVVSLFDAGRPRN